MSCHLLPSIQINDISGLREYLYPELKTTVTATAKVEEKGNKDKGIHIVFACLYNYNYLTYIK